MEELRKVSADIVVVVDRDFRKVYQGRSLHPFAQCEAVQVRCSAPLILPPPLFRSLRPTRRFAGGWSADASLCMGASPLPRLRRD
jgi:hypothetical protein